MEQVCLSVLLCLPCLLGAGIKRAVMLGKFMKGPGLIMKGPTGNGNSVTGRVWIYLAVKDILNLKWNHMMSKRVDNVCHPLLHLVNVSTRLTGQWTMRHLWPLRRDDLELSLLHECNRVDVAIRTCSRDTEQCAGSISDQRQVLKWFTGIRGLDLPVDALIGTWVLAFWKWGHLSEAEDRGLASDGRTWPASSYFDW